MKLIQLLLAITFLSASISLKAQKGKIDPQTNIKEGVLENGLTYYLCNNGQGAQGMVNFYLIQNVGAILEEDNQAGLAHFLEHMAFNGTKNFPHEEVQRLLEKKGYAGHINAYTGIDQTVYHITKIPSRDKATLDQCLIILHDWCDFLTLDEKEIDEERLIITEEIRSTNTLEKRLHYANMSVTHNNTKYAKRDILGTPEFIKSFKKKQLADFYHNWYRTDLQAIVVIGDIDVYDIETKIKRLCSDIKPINNPKKRYHIEIPDNKEILYKHITDNEIENSRIHIKYRHPILDDSKTFYMDKVIGVMLDNRTQKVLQDDSLNFTSFRIHSSKIAYGYCDYGLSVSCKNNREEEALKLAFDVHKDILDNNFTEEEFNFAIEKLSEGFKLFKKYKSAIPSEYKFEKIKTNFLENKDIIGPDKEYSEFKRSLKSITLDAINDRIKKLYSGPNKSIVVATKENKGQNLTKEKILQIEKKAECKKVIPDLEEEEVVKVKIVDKELKGSSVKESDKLKPVKAEKWVLENGATIVYKECNVKKGKINIYAKSSGGSSVYNGDDLVIAEMFKLFSPCFGIKQFTKEKLDEFLENNNINIKLGLADNMEHISMSCKYESIEYMFELLYSIFESPCLYENDFNKALKSTKEYVSNLDNGYKRQLNDTLAIIKTGKDRCVDIDSITLKKVSVEKLMKLYKERYKDASNFTFYIAGDISKGKAKKFAEKYIGSIKSINSGEKAIDRANNFPKGHTKHTFTYGTPASKGGINYTLELEKNLCYKDYLSFYIVNQYLAEKVNKVIRVLAKGTYGVSLKPYVKKGSIDKNGAVISFECDPQKAKNLNETLNLALEVIKAKGFADLDVKNYKKMFERGANGVRKNSQYISILEKYIERNEDTSAPDIYKKTLESIDKAYLNKILKEFLNNANILDVIYTAK